MQSGQRGTFLFSAQNGEKADPYFSPGYSHGIISLSLPK